MRRLLATLLLVFCASALPWSAQHVSASPGSLERTTATPGAISGVLVNGARHDAPVAGVAVALRASAPHGQPQDVTSATTDGKGHFTFDNLDGSGATTYDVYAQFQNGTFTSDAITFANGPTQQVTLRVYDTSTSDVGLRVSLATILFSPPNKQAGYIPVGEFITFDNASSTAYVAAPGAANGMPMGLLRFGLPAGATNLTLGAGFSVSQQITQVSTGFAATATIPPGQSQFAFAFDIPYTSSAYAFTYKAEYATDQVAVLMPMGIAVGAGDFTTQPPVTASGTHYQLFTRSGVGRDQHVTLTLSQLPPPGERPYLDFRALVGVGVIFALLLALLLMLYLRRGELAVVFGLVPASALRSRTRVSTRAGAGSQAERARLLRELLRVEASHDAGKLDDAAFRRRSGAVRAQLRELLAGDERTITPHPQPSAQGASAQSRELTPESAQSAAEQDDANQPKPAGRRAVTGGKR